MKLTDRMRAAVRTFLLGPAIVERWEAASGHEHDWAPAEYGNYLATSNGVYTCATLRANMLASLPLVLYKTAANGDRTPVEKGGLHDLLDMVNPFWTRNRLIEMTELSMCLWGQAFWFLERGNSGRMPPREIWWARPDRVKIIPDPVNYIGGYVYTPGNGAQPIRYTPGEVIWLRYPNPLDEYAGLSPLAAARISADMSSAAMQSNRAMFTNGNQMAGALLPPAGQMLTAEQAQELEKDLERRFSGVSKAHKWGVFKFDAQIKPLGFSPKDAEFLGALKWSLEDICRAYKVPLDMMGGERTYANVDGAQKAMWANCILPEARFLSTEIAEQMLPMFPGEADGCEFDQAGIAVLQEAEDAAWTRAKGQIEAGAITVNEWRKKKNLAPVPWGDVWWAGSSLKPIEGAEPEPPPPAPVIVAPPAEDKKPDEEQTTDESTVEPTEDEPDEDAAPRQAIVDELRRWQRKSQKRGPDVPFESSIIPAGMQALVTDRLTADPETAWAFLREIDPAQLDSERRLQREIARALNQHWGLATDAVFAGGTPDWVAFSDDLVNATDHVLASIMTEETLRQGLAVGIDFDPAVVNVAAWQWAREYSYTLVKGLTETTQALVAEATAKFISTPGMTVGELKALLENGFSPVRAEMISVTEVTRAYAMAVLDYQAMLKDMGLNFRRIWETSADERAPGVSRVCELCKPLHGKQESENGTWQAGGFPHEGPPLHVRCRCHTVLRLAKA
jgi:HK97 family phage portal protein